MNCREFARIVIELARNQVPNAALDAVARAQGLEHAELCIGCAARLAEEQAWLANVRVVAAEIAQQEAPVRVEATLRAALRAQAEGHHAPPRQPQPIAPRWLSWRLAALAAALLIFLAGSAWYFNDQEQTQQARPLPAPPLRAALPTLAVQEKTANAPTPVRAAVRRAPPGRAVRLPVALPSEAAAPFYSLVEEGQMAPLESGRIVRIEVPAATLVNLGLPLTEATLTQPVQADLLLGQDGLARAIRFLPNSQTARMQ